MLTKIDDFNIARYHFLSFSWKLNNIPTIEKTFNTEKISNTALCGHVRMQNSK